MWSFPSSWSFRMAPLMAVLYGESEKFQGRFEELNPRCFYRLVAPLLLAKVSEAPHRAAIVPSAIPRDRFLHLARAAHTSRTASVPIDPGTPLSRSREISRCATRSPIRSFSLSGARRTERADRVCARARDLAIPPRERLASPFRRFHLHEQETFIK